MGAITTILTLLKKGDHVVVSDDCYGGVYRIFARIVSNYGVESTFVDMTDLIAVEDAVRPETKMIWTETPTNPLMKVVDLKELAVSAKAHNAISVCDNTFASPYLQQPLTLGIDLAVHSVTKYLGGHADILGGAVVTRRNDLHERLKFAQNALGAVPSPFDCWLEPPASMPHASLPKEEREARGITDGLVRLSVGIEDIEDLVEDFQRALA